MEYKSNNNVVYSCKYHVVWCPKYRRKVLTGDIKTRLKQLIESTCQKENFELIETEIMPDHVHLLLEVDPQYGINKAVRRIKAVSARILRKEFKELTTKIPTMWTNSYLVSTEGEVSLEAVKKYIENQTQSQRKPSKPWK